MSVSEVPVFGVMVVEYAFALASMLLRKSAMAWHASVLTIQMCACLNWMLFGMIEKCMLPSVEFGGNGKVFEF